MTLPTTLTATPIELLLIEDDLVDELALIRALQHRQPPYRVSVARSVAQARTALAAQHFDIILADCQLGDGTSFELMDALAGQLFIFVTGAGDEDLAVRALEMGAHDYLLKDDAHGYLKLLPWRVQTALRQRAMARHLEKSEIKFKAVLDASPVPTALNDEALNVTYLNPAFVETFGYTAQDIPNIVDWWPLAYPDPAYAKWVQDAWVARFKESKRTGNAFVPLEVKIRCKDGSDRFALTSASSLVPGFEEVHLVLLYDITERINSEQVLRDREQRFRDLVESSDGIVWEADAQTFGFQSVSENAERMLGYPAQDWLQSGFWASHIHPEDREQAIAHCASCTGRLEDHDFEYRFMASGGRVVWLRDIVRVVADNGQPRWLRGLMIDITRHKQVESELHTALLDKTALLKEVHHRVKNNLQVITSLLRLEAARGTQAETKIVLGEMQARIRSMALLHESLYRANSFAQVDLGAYLKQLSQQAFRASADSGTVRLEQDMVQVPVSLDQATPAGLLVNELISNSLKHAFPQGRSGVVRVTLQPTPDGRWCLQVSDDGVGLPGDFAARRTQSLGLQLVDDLSQQMQGNLHVESSIGASGGSSFSVIFTSQICL